MTLVATKRRMFVLPLECCGSRQSACAQRSIRCCPRCGWRRLGISVACEPRMLKAGTCSRLEQPYAGYANHGEGNYAQLRHSSWLEEWVCGGRPFPTPCAYRDPASASRARQNEVTRQTLFRCADASQEHRDVCCLRDLSRSSGFSLKQILAAI